MALRYLLGQCLKSRKSVAFCGQDEFILFDANGVRALPYNVCWIGQIDVSLHDSVGTYITPHSTIERGSTLVVQATGTGIFRYKSWTKQREKSCFYVVAPWTWEEMARVEYDVFLSSLTSQIADAWHSLLRAKYAPDEREGTAEERALYYTTREAFDIFGPDAFRCLARRRREIPFLLEGYDMRRSFDLLQLHDIINEDSKFHFIFTIIPKKNRDSWEAKSSAEHTFVHRNQPMLRWTDEWMRLWQLIEFRPQNNHYFGRIMDAFMRSNAETMSAAAWLFTLSPSMFGQFYHAYVHRKALARQVMNVLAFRDGISTAAASLHFGNAPPLDLPPDSKHTIEVRERTLYIPEPDMAAIDFVWYEAGVA